ncbi:uncharacterized protein LOC117179784 isoform X2 [Belonocnema kinseyi]|uniref:uncharacterized protein LOC117179784 isoform X2 n=1 Tax=Belonocnema kinseyi TaxID=2817044 RepID=UPI00143DD130|nr:uncharacterized protein LOC117179784 isoform X2 [Belonocnema kinseyi]
MGYYTSFENITITHINQGLRKLTNRLINDGITMTTVYQMKSCTNIILCVYEAVISCEAKQFVQKKRPPGGCYNRFLQQQKQRNSYKNRMREYYKFMSECQRQLFFNERDRNIDRGGEGNRGGWSGENYRGGRLRGWRGSRGGRDFRGGQSRGRGRGIGRGTDFRDA